MLHVVTRMSTSLGAMSERRLQVRGGRGGGGGGGGGGGAMQTCWPHTRARGTHSPCTPMRATLTLRSPCCQRHGCPPPDCRCQLAVPPARGQPGPRARGRPSQPQARTLPPQQALHRAKDDHLRLLHRVVNAGLGRDAVELRRRARRHTPAGKHHGELDVGLPHTCTHARSLHAAGTRKCAPCQPSVLQLTRMQPLPHAGMLTSGWMALGRYVP
jgi:hypothetical protein